MAKFADLTTGDVVHKWVKLVTGDRRLADCPELVDAADVGVPSHFVSHAWRGSFAKLVATVEGFLRNAPVETLVWIDCFAVNQHPETCLAVNQQDVASFEVLATSPPPLVCACVRIFFALPSMPI